MKYKILTLALLPILAVTLTACTLSELPVVGKFFSGVPMLGGGNAELTMWGLWEDPQVMDALIKKYQEKHPNVKIAYEDRSVLNLSDYKQAVFTRSQQTGTADIIRVHNSWVSRLQDSLAPMPNNLMTAKVYSDKFYPIASQSAVFDNKIYGIPLYYDGLVLLYNKSQFNEIGQEEAPKVWEEFRRVASELTIRGGDRGEDLLRAGAAMGSSTNIDTFSDILGLMFAQADGDTPSEIDSKQHQDALAFYVNFLKEDKVWSITYPEATTAFAQGNVSMIIVPSWKILDILNDTTKVDFEIGVAPVPQALPETPASWASFWMDVVPSTSKNAAAAWDFLNFLAQEEQQLFTFNENSKNRPFGAAYSLVNLANQLDTNPYLKPALDTASIAHSSELAGRSGNKKQTDAMAQAVNDVLSGITPEEALQKVKETLSK